MSEFGNDRPELGAPREAGETREPDPSGQPGPGQPIWYPVEQEITPEEEADEAVVESDPGPPEITPEEGDED